MRLNLGRVCATPGAIEAAREHGLNLLHLVVRHASGDWGCVSDNDKKENELAISEGLRVLSAYPLDDTKECRGYGANCVWVITEADRSSTTVLLPDEY